MERSTIMRIEEQNFRIFDTFQLSLLLRIAEVDFRGYDILDSLEYLRSNIFQVVCQLKFFVIKINLPKINIDSGFTEDKMIFLLNVMFSENEVIFLFSAILIMNVEEWSEKMLISNA